MTRALLTLVCAAATASAVAQAPGGTAAPPPSAEDRKVQAALDAAIEDINQKRFDAALEKLGALEKTHPDDPFILNLIGAAHTRKKEYDVAKACFEKALAKDPAFFPARFNVGELLFLQKKYPAAYDYFQGMLNDNPRNELLEFKAFLCLMQMNKMDDASKALKSIPFPGNTPAWYYAQAAWALKQGDSKKAQEYLAGARTIFGQKTALFDETFDDLGLKAR